MTDYNSEVQKLFLEFMLSNAENYVRVQNIYNFENFDRNLRSAAKFIKDHADQYKTLPDLKQIHAVTGTALTLVADIKSEHDDWFLDEFEKFTKQKELERAILSAADLIGKGDFEPVEKLIKDAVQISLTKDMGTNYFADPKQRLLALKQNNGQISTGWASLDQILYGGMKKGELNIFSGGSGSGKSLIMMNLAINWVLAGLSGVYLTLELSENLCCQRADSMITGIANKNIFREIDDVELKVKLAARRAGEFRVKYFPAQSTVNAFKSYVRELSIQQGFKPDFIIIDYLDLMMPASVKIDPTNTFIKDKYVSEELRNLAEETRTVVVTGSQLNRGATEEIEFDHSHIAGGISKIFTADNVFGIFTSRAMRERGRYQIQAMKTRSSSGVGQKIDLGYDIDTLRIINLSESELSQLKNESPVDSVLKNLKPIVNIKPGAVTKPAAAEQPKITAEAQSASLANMLNQLRAGTDK
jgi:KaiC/GvpD/RAD55 family RecA-like ATPase